MKTCGKYFITILLLILFGCSLSGNEDGFLVFSHSFDFAQGQYDWQVDFTDFPAGADDSVYYELKFAYTDRPANLGTEKKSMMLSGNNHGHLFMFMKKKITNLTPNTDYTIVFEVELASNATQGGGSFGAVPGEFVFLKAGASGTEPRKVIDGNYFALNVDKGTQSAPGETTVVLGDIAVSTDTPDYTLITRHNASMNDSPFIVKSNSKGELWLMVGTDSSFEGITTVYYTKVNVVFSTDS